jgi:hypothetical protein
MVAIKLAGRYRAFTHLKQGPIERSCRPHGARAVKNSAAAPNKRVEGRFLIVVLPALKVCKADGLDSRAAQMNAGSRGWCETGGDYNKTKGNSNECAEKRLRHALIAQLQWQSISSLDRVN